jgi:hypothetical protein
VVSTETTWGDNLRIDPDEGGMDDGADQEILRGGEDIS